MRISTNVKYFLSFKLKFNICCSIYFFLHFSGSSFFGGGEGWIRWGGSGVGGGKGNRWAGDGGCCDAKRQNLGVQA